LRDQKTAVKDWRFGRVRIESLDMKEIVDTKLNTNMASTQRPRGESSFGDNGINAGLAPEAASVGRVTKARYEVVEGKNTEVGWGIVHLYRDGEETPGLGNTEVVYTAAGSEAPTHQRKPSAGLGVKGDDNDEEDCTTLCIPAVPSYLTPSDFLGFVGEKTREEVSHFRMVMTGRMNRYLVLMKFRDGNTARRWRKVWDGKVFNSMEVSFPSFSTDIGEKLTLASARNMSCYLYQIHYLSNTYLLSTEYQLPRALSRSFHAIILDILLEAVPPTNTESRRITNMSRLPRTNGRHIWPPHNPLPARLPLQLSPKMARKRLSRLSTHKSFPRTLLLHQYQYIPL
jgi:hypothetical protein